MFLKEKKSNILTHKIADQLEDLLFFVLFFLFLENSIQKLVVFFIVSRVTANKHFFLQLRNVYVYKFSHVRKTWFH